MMEMNVYTRLELFSRHQGRLAARSSQECRTDIPREDAEEGGPTPEEMQAIAEPLLAELEANIRRIDRDAHPTQKFLNSTVVR